MLLQAHPHLSGFLFGVRLFRLLWCCDRGPGAWACHHVLAQWEMGLHRCALCFPALRPQEVCHQGDLSLLLRWLCFNTPQQDEPKQHGSEMRNNIGCVHRCSCDWAHTGQPPWYFCFLFFVFCPSSGFHYKTVFMQLCQRTKAVKKFAKL